MEQKRDRDPDPDLNLVYLTIMSPTWPEEAVTNEAKECSISPDNAEQKR